jgi:hypothetical protein
MAGVSEIDCCITNNRQGTHTQLLSRMMAAYSLGEGICLTLARSPLLSLSTPLVCTSVIIGCYE